MCVHVRVCVCVSVCDSVVFNKHTVLGCQHLPCSYVMSAIFQVVVPKLVGTCTK